MHTSSLHTKAPHAHELTAHHSKHTCCMHTSSVHTKASTYAACTQPNTHQGKHTYLVQTTKYTLRKACALAQYPSQGYIEPARMLPHHSKHACMHSTASQHMQVNGQEPILCSFLPGLMAVTRIFLSTRSCRMAVVKASTACLVAQYTLPPEASRAIISLTSTALMYMPGYFTSNVLYLCT
jgi:hypothetical protein